MKILFVFSTLGGGIQTLNDERKKALSQIGLECHFLYLRNRAIKEPSKDSHLFFSNKENEIKSLIIDQQYEFIAVCTYYIFLETLRKIGYKGKIIYDFQGIGDFQSTVRWLKKSQAIVMKYADGIMFPKVKFLDVIMKEHFPTKKLFSFHNSIDNGLFHYKDVPKPKNTIFGWVGRLDANKNWQEFLLAGATLKERIPNLQLWLFHDPTVCSKSSQQAFARLVKRLDLTRSLVIYENIPRAEMPRFYSMMAKSGGILCSTSKQEGFGYAVIEAMCCKCPVLTTRSGGVENFVVHDVTGKLYEQGDINKCVMEAQNLIVNKNLREKIIEQACHLIRTFFTPEMYAQNFMHMLQSIISKS